MKFSKIRRRIMSFFFKKRAAPVVEQAALAAIEQPALPAVKQPSFTSAPNWYRSSIGPDLKAAIDKGRPTYLFVNWIAEHGNAVIDSIQDPRYELAAFDFVQGVQTNDLRRTVLRFAAEHPDVYRQMIIRRLVPLRNQIRGFIFTFDWPAVTRIMASVCEELEIPKILIPHESVFTTRDKYYWDPKSNASVPIADLILGWGDMQREIFSERGYPPHRFVAVGAPKFDVYKNYSPQLSRKQFCNLYGLDPDRKILLFAAQPLDSQLDTQVARKSQRDAIKDLSDYCLVHNLQLIVRMPPSKDDILGRDLRTELNSSQNVTIDNAGCYMVGPEESLYHSDVVTSVNSTMLFEGALLGKPALSIKYVEFDQIWEKVGIPAVTTKADLNVVLTRILEKGWVPSPAGMKWAAKMSGTGEFDGSAHTRVAELLSKIALGIEVTTQFPSSIDRLDNGGPLDVIAVADDSVVVSNQHLTAMLNARTQVQNTSGTESLISIAAAEIFVLWGTPAELPRKRQIESARALGRPLIYVDRGILRYTDTLSEEAPCLSITLGDGGQYYDGSANTRMQKLLQDGPALTGEQTARADACLEVLRRHRIPYSYGKLKTEITSVQGRRRILVIDEPTAGHEFTELQSNVDSFKAMLGGAVEQNPDCSIIVMQHVDEQSGVPDGYLSNEVISAVMGSRNVEIFTCKHKSYELIEGCDSVFVFSSIVGFEALLLNKEVYCYGKPFFAGWGVTKDIAPISGRSAKRTLAEIFHRSQIDCSRYFDPLQSKTVQVEDFISYLIKMNGNRPQSNRFESIIFSQ